VQSGNAAGSSIGGLTLRGAQAFGFSGVVAQFHEAALRSMGTEIQNLQAQMQHAQAIGATDVAQQIQDQINDLGDQVSEMFAQMIQDRIDAVNNAAQFKQGRVDVLNRIAQARATITGNALGGISAQQQDLRSSQDIATAQRAGLIAILGFDPASRQFDPNALTTTQQQLIEQIDGLDATMAENSAQLVTLNATYRQTATQQISDRIGSQSTFTSAASDIITKLQAISGIVDPTQLKAIAATQADNLKNNAGDIGKNIAQAMAQSDLFAPGADSALGNLLSAFQEGAQPFAIALANMTPLLETLEQGMPDATRQVFEQLIQSMIDNTSATLDNTQNIDTLNGTFTQPQTFSSTAWQWFHNAIFTGMGGVLPQFQIAGSMSGVDTGSIASPAALGSSTVAGGDGATNKQEFNFEINEAGGPIDLTELGATVGWAAKTAQE
jgi:hypothetical protein